MLDKKSTQCPDCDGLTRRDFLRAASGGALAVAAGGLGIAAAPRVALAADNRETLIATLYKSMTDAQKTAVCFGWDHPKRQMISNNWHIVPQKIGEFFMPDQQDLISQIFKASHSEEWLPKRLQQLKDDDAGIHNYNIAIFGQPGSGKFEWVMTGRHLTLRVDGDSEPGVAFGGPIFYGHAAQGFNEKPDHPGNVYWYQALRANEVFAAMDGKQRAVALQTGPVPPEAPSVLVPKPADQRVGLPVADMSRDQQELVQKVLADVLAPCSKADALEAMRYVKANGGVKSLHMSFYKAEDVGNDGVWDVWKLEGPAMCWYFRGAPHVHTWVYLSEKPLLTPPPGPAPRQA